MFFTGGIQSPIACGEVVFVHMELLCIPHDEIIQYVSLKKFAGRIKGFKFTDKKGQVIIVKDWDDWQGSWTTPVKIPESAEIIGMKWSTNGKWISKLDFNIWKPNAPNGI